ncbi:hypothetical protein IC620_02400 [Hazenella sp. IB182357]|uniref:Uncharacterized protein n=1 Tax=Polycladospora coralii TaxID=2771432 RepID=A0A926N4Y7_9BACL|nr:hypothetical protein [Polycladospora coralii]MBD1371209.1 hypothetical protein [Polycladospora coralii]MBS7530151.1 hypothetical protein [Polycladospora coralii]
MSRSAKKMLGVTFHMSDPLDRELYHYVEEKSDNFSDLVKHLIFAWRHGYQISTESNGGPSELEQKKEIKNSGLPFG